MSHTTNRSITLQPYPVLHLVLHTLSQASIKKARLWIIAQNTNVIATYRTLESEKCATSTKDPDMSNMSMNAESGSYASNKSAISHHSIVATPIQLKSTSL